MGKQKKANPVTRFLRKMGPGLVTGAADDDPSGIATYSVAGAQHGMALLWTAGITWPLMYFVQMMCARISMVTGRGLAAVLREKLPGPILVLVTFALFAANTINIGADLAGMADAAEMLTGWNSHWFLPPFAAAITVASIWCRYDQVARILKWLALALLAYAATAVFLKPEWKQALLAAIVPTWPKDAGTWKTLVAILGTTISPYLFFWQSSQEVEEEKAKGRKSVAKRRGASGAEISDRKIDVAAGTFASNSVMYFIILTAALTLHARGVTHIETSREAAEALRPLAGKFAAGLFAAGVIGTGFLAIPTLAGSGAYALAETFGWREGLDENFQRAPAFYATFALAIVTGMCLDFLNVNPIAALVWTALINGILAPFLLIGILLVAGDRKIMKGQPSSCMALAVVGLVALAMFGAALALFMV